MHYMYHGSNLIFFIKVITFIIFILSLVKKIPKLYPTITPTLQFLTWKDETISR